MYKELFKLTVVYPGGLTKDFTFSSKKDRFTAYKMLITFDPNADLKFTFWESIKEVCNE